MAKKRGLGKGLEALFPPDREEEGAIAGDKGKEKISFLSVDELEPNEFQPRQGYDEEKLQELANSIKEHGVVQPIVVRQKSKGKYEIVAGERRWRASRLAGIDNIPAIIKEFSQEELTEIALVENIQREDLNALEEAAAYQILIREFSLKQEDIAKRVGKSRSFVANMLRLLDLEKEVQSMVMDGMISGGHARALLALKGADQVSAAARVANEGLNVRDTEDLIKRIVKDKIRPQKKSTKTSSDSWLLERENFLKEFFDTEVRIKGKRRGRIEIEFRSSEDLDRILNYIDPKKDVSRET